MNRFIAGIKGMAYPIIDYAKQYDGDNTANFAKGEIERFKMAHYPKDIWVGRRFLGSGHDEKGEYDTIHIYIGDGWAKLVSKVY